MVEGHPSRHLRYLLIPHDAILPASERVINFVVRPQKSVKAHRRNVCTLKMDDSCVEEVEFRFCIFLSSKGNGAYGKVVW